MEVLSSLAGLDITIDSPKKELEKLVIHGLAREILIVDNNPPYNHPSGKMLLLKIRRNQKKPAIVEYIPARADWNQLKYIRINIKSEVI